VQGVDAGGDLEARCRNRLGMRRGDGMRRLGVSGADSGAPVEINMAPLIDCVFLLLIFFVVTAVFVRETGVEVQRPRAMSAEQLEKRSILIGLTADNRIFYGGREIELNGVRGLVARQLREMKGMPVVIVADTESRNGPLVDIIDECKLAGAERVSVAAEMER
jgi:biopolymer transport protein ExbD